MMPETIVRQLKSGFACSGGRVPLVKACFGSSLSTKGGIGPISTRDPSSGIQVLFELNTNPTSEPILTLNTGPVWFS